MGTRIKIMKEMIMIMIEIGGTIRAIIEAVGRVEAEEGAISVVEVSTTEIGAF